MAIPDYPSMMLPMLRRLGGGRSTAKELASVIADEFQLGEAERGQLLPSAGKTVFMNRVYWALFDLKRAGLIERVDRGTFVVTDRGRGVLKQPPERISIAFLRQFSEFAGSRVHEVRPSGKAASADIDRASAADPSATPDEQITAALALIEANLRDDLLQRLLAAPPAFFEQVVIDLLVAMGYGSTVEDAGQALGRSGDGGVDGVIREDRLGLDLIYVQAKRYRDNAVTSDQLRSFAGALDDKGARKGVFITTSRFTADAEGFAARQQTKRIVLMDGERLTRLMLRHDVGVRAQRTIVLKRLDLDYFEPDDAT